MNVTEIKRIISGLSVYANARATTKGPTSTIGVQSGSDGRIKLIAGNSKGGIVVSAGSGSSGRAGFTIESRPFLSAVKTFKGKLDLSFSVSERGLSILTDKGGSADFRNVGDLREAGFAKKPKQFLSVTDVPGSVFSQAARIFDAVQRDIESSPPSLHFYDDVVALTAKSPVNGEMYATVSLPAQRLVEAEQVYGTAYMDFWQSLKVLEQDGTLEFGDDGVIARSGIFECYSAPYRVSAWNPKTRKSAPPEHPKPHPTLGWNDKAATARVRLDRKQLIEAIKGQAPNDQYARVTLVVDTGTLKVHAFGAEDGITLPVTSEGKGVRSVQSELTLNLLRAMDDSKEIEIAWGSGPGLRIHGKEYESWTVLIAPVTMNN